MKKINTLAEILLQEISELDDKGLQLKLKSDLKLERFKKKAWR